jgi:hypothetical protein
VVLAVVLMAVVVIPLVEYLIKHHSLVQHLMVTRVVMVQEVQTGRGMVIPVVVAVVQVRRDLRIQELMAELAEPVEHLAFQVHQYIMLVAVAVLLILHKVVFLLVQVVQVVAVLQLVAAHRMEFQVLQIQAVEVVLLGIQEILEVVVLE